jgi:hypothetical protein
MTLFSLEQIDQIINQALDNDLFEKRSVLLSGIDKTYVSGLEIAQSPRDQLFLDVRDMNNADSPIGGEIPLRVWLGNAAFALAALPVAASFKARAAEIVAQAAPEPEEAERRARASLQTLKELAGADPRLRAAIAAASTELDAIGKGLRPLAAIKALHDLLHRFQISGLPMLQSTLRKGSLEGDQTREMVQLQADELGMTIERSEGELESLSDAEKAEQHDQLKKLADIQKRLDDAVANQKRLDDAVANQKPLDGAADIQKGLDGAVDNSAWEQASDALTDLRREFQLWMPRLNSLLFYKSRDLNIPRLVGHIRSFAGESLPVQDPRAAQLRDAATRLSLLDTEIKALLVEHDNWQRIDDELWPLEDDLLYKGESLGALRSFSRQWPLVVEKVARAGGSAPPEWLEKTQRYAVTFVSYCPIPVKPPIKPVAVAEFGNFIKAIRRRFYTVDGELNKRCNRLAAITEPLEDLARSF